MRVGGIRHVMRYCTLMFGIVDLRIAALADGDKLSTYKVGIWSDTSGH